MLKLIALLETQRARPREALAACDALLALGERSAELFLQRGELLHALGRDAEALQSYDRALATAPRLAEALNNRGVVLMALGRAKDAIASYDSAVAAKPDYALAHFNRGVALDALDQPARALESYDRALAIAPDHVEALTNRGVALAALAHHAEALESYARALALAPEDAETLANRSASLRALGRLDAALKSAEQALALRPAHPQGLNARGLAQSALGLFDAAVQSYEAALALRPAYPEALNNLGLAQTALGRLEAAIVSYNAALAIDPALAKAEFNRGLNHLRLGQLEAGWRRYEARWRRNGAAGPPGPEGKLWLGEGDIAGRTLLVHAEQGLGDTLQVCRFVPRAASLGARVVLRVQPPLQTVLAGLAGIAELTTTADADPPFDRHIPLMSLPLALRIGADAISSPPYLSAEPARVEAWRARLADAGAGPRVGLVWAGNPAHEDDRNRSLALARLAPLLSSAVHFVSLQKAVPDADCAALDQLATVTDVSVELGDFADTAALAQACDLVISVDTSVAHLAGALGRPVWILLPYVADWRWMAAGPHQDVFARTPWYPSARLYRQRRFGDWDEVIARVRADLDAGPPFA